MKCPKCGNILENNTKFCVNCGTKINNKKNIKKIIFLVATTIIIIILFLVLVVNILELKNKKEAEKFRINPENDEIVRDTDDVTVEELNMKVPVKFTSSKKMNNTDDNKLYQLNSTKNYCNISIIASQIKENYDEKALLEEQFYMDERYTYSEIEEKEINNKKWYTQTSESPHGTKSYYYVTYHNSLSYTVHFSMFEDSGACSKAQDEIINSMRFN